ncbi:serine acetyltransferase [Candidatus Gracilibacteria bacterium]|nr:serine acetyltransferase [Candidatus Gracilibacteria bacterium]
MIIDFRMFFNAEHRAVNSYRLYSFVYKKISKGLGYVLYNRAKLKYGCDIAPTAKIGAHFKIAHIGGIVIGRNAIIGNNCTINNNVTLGMKNKDKSEMPKLGDNIYVSSGAKLLGDIQIGNNCIIGANSVVVNSFNKNLIIAGIPAKILKKN